MNALARSGMPAGEWLTIREASALVGVSVATLRRWSNAGALRVYTTPGGHRRFARSTVLGLIAAERGGQAGSEEADDRVAHQLMRAYRRSRRTVGRAAMLPVGMSGDGLELFRRYGREMIGALVGELAAGGEDGEHAGRAHVTAEACGRLARDSGLSLNETLELFVRFRAPFLHQLSATAGQRGLDAGAATALLERASAAIDRLLPAVIAGFEANGQP